MADDLPKRDRTKAADKMDDRRERDQRHITGWSVGGGDRKTVSKADGVERTVKGGDPDHPVRWHGSYSVHMGK